MSPKFDFQNRLDQLRRHRVLGENLWPWPQEGRDVYVDTSNVGYHYGINDSRIKAVGGSTLHWGGMAQRLSESDFETASRYGLGIDWPIGYMDLEPYYAAAEHEIGVSGTPNVNDPPRSGPYPMPGFPPPYEKSAWSAVAKRLGISLEEPSHARNSVPYAGRSQCIAYAVCSVCPSGARYSADFHIEKALKSGKCTLLTETVARRIEVSGSGSVTAIHATTLADEDYELKASSYVIAAHAIETARLLLLSGVGNHSSQVGRNLMEHWYLTAGGVAEDQLSYPGRIGFTTLESSHYYDGDERRERGAVKLEFNFRGDPLLDAGRLKKWGNALDRYDCEQFGQWVVVDAETEQQPNPDSYVMLDKNVTDRFGDPAPHTHFDFTAIDRKTHQRSLEIIRELLEARGVKDIVSTPHLERAHHHMGTCRMSDDPDLGVVDRNCRIHGTKNIYVAGSSVFPTSGAKQPTLTIAALALRLADHIALQKKI